MRGVRSWPEDDAQPKGEVVYAAGRYVCREHFMSDEEVELSMIRATPEPISVGEMCRAVRLIVSTMGVELGVADEMLSDGRAGVILDGHQLGVGLRVRNALRGGGFRWSSCALDDCWLTLLFEALEVWRRGRRLEGRDAR